MLFKYPLSDAQYQRFQHATNDQEIHDLAERAGVEVTDEKVIGGVETVYFRGRCAGTMALVPCDPSGERWGNSTAQRNMDQRTTVLNPHHWECWIRVQSKPWWLPWFVLDWGFRKALE